MKDSQRKAMFAKGKSGLQPFVMKRIGENIGELDLELKDIRNLLSEKLRRGDKAVGGLRSQQRTVGQSRNSIVSLVETLPANEQIKIGQISDAYKKEFSE